MGNFSEEILRRFPEVWEIVHDGDEELPYLMVRHIAEWLARVAKRGFDQGLIKRLVEFNQWCAEHPKGKSAEDDVWTIYLVGFLEKLFEDDALVSLIGRLMVREDLERNREYFVSWVGKDRYELAMRQRCDVVRRKRR